MREVIVRIQRETRGLSDKWSDRERKRDRLRGLWDIFFDKER